MDVLWPIEPKDAARFPGYHLGVFQLGNNVEFHLEIYRAAFLTNALVVLHDLALDDFVRGLKTAGDPLGYMAAREAARLRHALTDPDVVRNEPLREPWCAHVARRARGMIVHSEFGRRYLEGVRVPDTGLRGAASRDRATRRLRDGGEPRARELRASLGDPAFLVVAPGDMNEAKQLDALVHAAAVARRRRARGDRRPAHRGLRRGVRDRGAPACSGRVSVHADVSDADFLAWLAAADAVVDLRFPHRGEVSGSLEPGDAGREAVDRERHGHVPRCARRLRAAGGARPDRPRRARRRRSVDFATTPVSALASVARPRPTSSACATTEATARGYERAIDETLALVRDPARKAMGIWGKSLVDVGITEEMVARGLRHGVREGPVQLRDRLRTWRSARQTSNDRHSASAGRAGPRC